jgi:hypothetical protein
MKVLSNSPTHILRGGGYCWPLYNVQNLSYILAHIKDVIDTLISQISPESIVIAN